MNKKAILAWSATFVWITVWLSVICFDLENAKRMAFNEWGDFLAGISAPLAFLWLVVGYFQQGEELAQNTEALKQQEKALRLQAKELSQSVTQQRELASATRQSVDLAMTDREEHKAAERRRARPIFRFTIKPTLNMEGKEVYSGFLKNIGESVSKVTTKTNSSVIFQLRNSTHLDRNDPKSFRLIFSKVIPAPHSWDLAFEYTNSLGEIDRSDFLIIREEAGSIDIIPN